MPDSMRDSAKKYNVRGEVSVRLPSQVSPGSSLALWFFKSSVRKSARYLPQKICVFPMRDPEGLLADSRNLAFSYPF
jgi:hypothetical protein